jgi:hypothetical protein
MILILLALPHVVQISAGTWLKNSLLRTRPAFLCYCYTHSNLTLLVKLNIPSAVIDGHYVLIWLRSSVRDQGTKVQVRPWLIENALFWSHRIHLLLILKSPTRHTSHTHTFTSLQLSRENPPTWINSSRCSSVFRESYMTRFITAMSGMRMDTVTTPYPQPSRPLTMMPSILHYNSPARELRKRWKDWN